MDYLLPGEYVLIEVELNLFVSDVNAELLEGVALEVLEAEDVQDADVQILVFLSGLGGGGGDAGGMKEKRQKVNRMLYE